MVLIFALVALASELGLDLLLGGFIAGVITRIALKGRDVRIFESKPTAVGYGFLPFFFITSGLKFRPAGDERPTNALKVLSSWPSSWSCAAQPPAALPRAGPKATAPRSRSSPRPSCRWCRHHHDRGRAGPHALVDRGLAGRRGNPVDHALPARPASSCARAAPAWSRRRARLQRPRAPAGVAHVARSRSASCSSSASRSRSARSCRSGGRPRPCTRGRGSRRS